VALLKPIPGVPVTSAEREHHVQRTGGVRQVPAERRQRHVPVGVVFAFLFAIRGFACRSCRHIFYLPAALCSAHVRTNLLALMLMTALCLSECCHDSSCCDFLCRDESQPVYLRGFFTLFHFEAIRLSSN